ncbi:entry exclusion lipoprotein TrbK [Marinomonas fungiae]|uniref:Entry exclusion lipoprotein TrbK n=1 Tax=Marinomonas fungiae TaxID=1137284 RepID=A0A0K6IJR3_9GAMM|nr:entry exclusion lipoprotein TrbK [Marinomonas fungiae]CUB03334.1 entry exclusion lipoprotein TrbK [Marinomonas fungiae]
MNMTKPKYIAGLLAVAALTTACSEKMPNVSEENCTQTNIQKIEDSQIREKFSDQCFDFRIEQGKEKASNLLEQGQESAEEMLENGKEAAADAYDSTTDAMKDGADAVNDAWDDGVDAVQDGADEAADKMDAATN